MESPKKKYKTSHCRRSLEAIYSHILFDQEVSDVRLIGHDAPKNQLLSETDKKLSPVPAVKAILAGRSPVLRRMLFGDFCESGKFQCGYGSDAPVIPLPNMTTNQIKTIVHYCYTNTIVVNNTNDDDNSDNKIDSSDAENELRQLVRLIGPANFLDMNCLVQALLEKVGSELEAHWTAKKYYMLAVAYDEASNASVKAVVPSLERSLLRMIGLSPFEILLGKDGAADSDGKETMDDTSIGSRKRRLSIAKVCGVTKLREDALRNILKYDEINASEMQLFEILHKWVESAACTPTRKQSVEGASEAHFSPSEPSSLLPESSEEKDDVPSDLCKEDIAKDLLDLIDLTRLLPSVLSGGALVHNYGMSKSDVMDICMKQALMLEKSGEPMHDFCLRRRGKNGIKTESGVCMVFGGGDILVDNIYVSRNGLKHWISLWKQSMKNTDGGFALVRRDGSWAFWFRPESGGGWLPGFFRGGTNGTLPPRAEWVKLVPETDDNKEDDDDDEMKKDDTENKKDSPEITNDFTPVCVVLEQS